MSQNSGLNMVHISRISDSSSGNGIGKIKLFGYDFGGLIYSTGLIQRLRRELSNVSQSLMELYMGRASPSLYTIEDVIDSAITGDFTSVYNVRGLDITYSGMTLHIRICVDGEDERTPHNSCEESASFVSSFMGSTITIHREKFMTGNRDEYWEYYVTL